ncbi:pentapeptide repeat-containing protein [Actinotalea sp. BY-33]|uniref:Pentapeptide repeat-containing protein n=1 Tax=Actinotalea soli TaxID=2819234 RepID=A0A939LTH7_9CELL|nr:pentapeptide repeat-containing protein [Actinotalea soli]
MPEGAATRTRLDLVADCSRCLALCCVALPFERSAEFGLTKAGGTPCPNLDDGLGCSIHARLRPAGFAGCATYDCLGAGQHLTQVTFTGRDWRTDPTTAGPMFAALPVMTQLHEMLWYLTEVLDLAAARPVHAEVRSAVAHVEHLTDLGAEELLTVDLPEQRSLVGELLSRASSLARAHPRDGTDPSPVRSCPDLRGADLVGATFPEADLRRADLRGALLVGADLRGADLRGADLLGTDLRGAELAGADLRETLFLTGTQLDAAHGDSTTLLPQDRTRPRHW